MKYLLFVAVGGASGAVARYALALWVQRVWEGHFPLATLLINILGSFAIGLLFVLITEKELVHPDWRGVLMVGFLGAFTTFSTFSLETIVLLEAGHITHAVGYMLLSVALCVMAAGSGIVLARLFT
jgi:CrcB protein